MDKFKEEVSTTIRKHEQEMLKKHDKILEVLHNQQQQHQQQQQKILETLQQIVN